MSGATWHVRLYHPTGVLLDVIDEWISLDLARSVNTVGAATMILPGDYDHTLLHPDGWLEFWREVDGRAVEAGDTRWIIRGIVREITARGERFIEVGAQSALALLADRIVAYQAKQSTTRKSGSAGNMLKAIVRENLGPSATDTTREIDTYLSVQADTTDGATLGNHEFARQNVLQTCQTIAQDSADRDTPIWFDVALSPGSSAPLEFRTYTGQRGVDHSGSGTAARVILSVDHGNALSMRVGYDYHDEWSHVYAGGGGAEGSRTIVGAYDATRIGRSPFGRREVFIDARNASTTDAVTAEAQAHLRKGRPRRVFEVEVVPDAPGSRYGVEWGWGDKLMAQFEDESQVVRCDSVSLQVSGGKETITAELRVEDEP